MDFQELSAPDENLDNYQQVDDIFNDFGNTQVQGQVIKSDAVMFVVDCNEALMQTFPNEQQSQISKIFGGYTSLLKSKIISNPNDKIGLMLYNVKKSNNGLKFNSINMVHPFDSPSAQRIKQASKLEQKFAQNYGFSEKRVPLYEVLWLYNNELKTIDKKKFHLRLFLFTNQDNPHAAQETERNQAINHAKQLCGQNVQIELFPMRKTATSKFDLRKFYINIITLDPEEINDAVLDSSEKIMDLQQRLRQKEYKKRTLTRLLMKVGNDTEIGLKIYSTFNKAKKPIAKKLDAKTNKPLKRVAKILSSEGDILHEADVGTFYPLGGQKVPLKKEDLKKLKSLEPPGMTLIGFKPKKKLKPYYNYRTSYFVYPDDQRIVGSSPFVDALVYKLIQKQLVAIIKFVPREGTQIRFCALIPQQESYDQDHFQIPAGFNLIFLPFSQDIVSHVGNKASNQSVEISNELVHVTKLLINNLTINDFDFRNFENPALQKFYAHLQAHALGESEVDQTVDLMKPDQQAMMKCDDIIQLIKDTVKLEISGKIDNKTKIKTECDSSGDEEKYAKVQKKIKKPKKQIKQQNQIKQEDMGGEDPVEVKFRNGELQSLKVPELKAFLKSKGLSQGGKKQELINRAIVFMTK